MLRNYTKIALRTLWKQKGITAINVLGLAAGMAVCLLVGLLFWDQLMHDDFHPGADRIYRITTQIQNNSQRYATSSAGLAPALREGVPGVETAVRMRKAHRNVVVDNQGYEAQGLYAEASFFDLFGFELERGNPERALAEPYTMVLTQDLARRLFGDTDPMGRTVRLLNVGPFTVTGILNRDAYRSHLKFDALYSFATLEQTRAEELAEWDASAFNYYTYLRLEKGRRVAAVEQSLQEIRNQHLPPPAKEDVSVKSFQLQALSDLPLGPNMVNRMSWSVLTAGAGFFFAALALLVLLAAGFNYVNLSTARSLTRAREVGVRKTVGAHRRQVMGQFIAEGLVVALLALGLAVVLLQFFVPAFNQLTAIRMSIEIEPGLSIYGAFVLFALGVGAVAGLYPAWHLSKFRPSRVLKASAQSKTPGFKWLAPRKVLVVLQFVFALIVTVSAVLFYRQARHKATAQYPIRTNGVAQVSLQETSFGPFQQKARQHPAVQKVGAVNSIPIVSRSKSGISVASERRRKPVASGYYLFDYQAVQVLDLPLVATKNFTEARFESGRAVLINEEAVQRFGFDAPREALGQPLTLSLGEEKTQSVRIVGIVRNFPLSVSEGEDVGPLVFRYDPDRFQRAVARVAPGQKQAALAALRETWSQLDEVNPFEGGFLRTQIRQQAASFLEVSRLLGVTAGFAVLISCLGLLGIATYTVQTRTREIGIRKALGATMTSIVSLLSRDFLWLVGAAVALGLPVAWWLNRLWLQEQAYRIELGVWPFVLSAVGLIALALLAIVSQTVRAARTDPARTLRDE